MRKLAKFLSLFIVLLLILSLIACGKDDVKVDDAGDKEVSEEPAKKDEKEDDDGEVELEPDLDFVTVSFYLRRPVDNMSAQAEVEEELNKHFKEKLNCEIQIFPIDVAAFDDKMRMMSAAGEAYDIAMTTSWTNSIMINVTNGSLLPLNDLLDEYGQNILAKNDPKAWQAATFDGKIMAIPGQTPYAQPSAFCYKAELIDKYDVDYRSMNTLAKLEPYLALLKENEPDIIPYYGSVGVGIPTITGVSEGIVFNEITEKIEYAFDDEEQVKNFRLLTEYYQKGYIAPDVLVRTEAVQEIKTGTYGVFNDPGGYTEDGSKSSGMYGFPCYETLYTYPLIQTNSMLGAGNGIGANSENPERAMMLLDLLWEDRYLSNTMAYGVEGTNYEVISGDIHDFSVDSVVEAKSGDEQTWAIWHNWVGPLWDQWSSNWNTTEALEKMQEDNDMSDSSKLLGFLFDPEPVKQEVAQLSAIWNEAEPILYSGSVPDLDSYIVEIRERMDNADGQKVIEEIERQIEEWKASN